MEKHTKRGRFIAAVDNICFTMHDGRMPRLSDIPRNATGLRFFSRARLRVPEGWQVDRALSRQVHDLEQRWTERAGFKFKSLWPVQLRPRPISDCPNSCSYAGTCIETVGDDRGAQCRCHQGFAGSSCAEVDASECLNRCSGHGRCESRFCNCEEGWFGLDCSLTRGSASTGRKRLAYAPTYVYPLPTALTMDFLYQRDPRWRGLFYTNRVFLEMLHQRHDALVANPEEATLFLIPVMLTQMRDSLWEAKRFLPALQGYIQARYPYWNRSGGSDHYFFTGQDMGGCWVPPALSSAMIVSHFGFLGSTLDWINSPMWQLARHSRSGWYPGRNPSQTPCYARKKDVVVPVDFSVTRLHTVQTGCALNDATAPRSLLYMAGSMRTRYASFYSQGVRQQFYRLHQNTSRVLVVDVGGWSAASMRNATFCLAPSGWGFGWRLFVSLAMLCIPVIIQPMVEQAFQEMLPYPAFSLRFQPVDIPTLPQQLRELERNRSFVCAMRASAARYYRALMWEPPGVAYDMLQASLCQRALMRILHVQERSPAARKRGLPSWYRCALLTADRILDSHPADQVSAWPAIRRPPYNQRT